ncbi:sensor histidine kinase [Paenibacillus sp. 481]|nr:sensor histidine kinase [Paenibacillus sp. 481]
MNGLQFRARRMRSWQLSYVRQKLQRIITEDTAEQILLATDDRELQSLLITLNRLLDHNRKTKGHYASLELSIKRLLANMSHDLKTPLTVILGLTETIVYDQHVDDSSRKRLLGKVHDKAQEMVSLINEFFDLAKLEAGDKELPLSTIQVNEIGAANMLFFYESITSQGLEVTIELPETPVYMLGHADALNRILQNLIANAIQYGSDGQVVGLAVRVEHDYVDIEVWDRGKGIDEWHQAHIFERLYTLEDSRNRRFQGSGLGLAITKTLVEKLNGTLTLHSVPHEKTSFTARFKTISH